MKATLLKVESKQVEVPDYRPVWVELEREGEPVALSANYDEINPTMFHGTNYKRIEYRLIVIRGGEHGENGYYFVNDAMWYKAAPVIQDIIEKELRPLTRENTELKILVASLNNNIRKLQSSWWERLKRKFHDQRAKLKQILNKE